MAAFLSFIFFLLLPLAIGILTIYLSIELFEHLKKYHPTTYKQMSFESLFGMSGENAFFHLIKPQEFFRFLLAPADLQDHAVKMFKQRIKISLLAFLGLIVIFMLRSLIF
jgi:hypothetical protein